MAKITFLGLGAMGSRMAENLIAAGHELTVWNRNGAKSASLVQKRATAAVSPREAVADAEFVMAMLRDDEASRHVWLNHDSGALASMAPGAMAIECSTLSLAFTRELARHCASRNQPFLDAPLAGSRPQAEARQLIFMAGGETGMLAKAKPLLLAMGAAVHHAGPAGAAASTMLANTFAPMFPVELVAKDFGYALDAAGSADMAPMIDAAKEVYARAMARGLGGDHLTSVVQLYRKGNEA